MIKHFLNPPNWFTSASIFCSTYALALLLSGDSSDPEVLRRACILVVFGGVFDLLDGRVARMTNRLTEFGVQLDSIADIISFGVAPAMLVWAWSLHELGQIGFLMVFLYVVCAAFRLARFNVSSAHDTWQLDGHSQGLTSTMAGGCLVTLAWMANGYLHHPLQILSPWAVGGIVTLLGLLMVSSVPFRTFRDIRRNRWARRFLAVALSACLVGALAFDPSMWFGVGAFLYLTWGLLDGIAVAIRHRRATGRSLDLDDELEEEELPALLGE